MGVQRFGQRTFVAAIGLNSNPNFMGVVKRSTHGANFSTNPTVA